MKKKIFVTGCGGMVGYYARDIFGAEDLTLTDAAGDHPKLDVTDAGQVMKSIAGARPDTVLHLAAATDVDRCEEDERWAYRCNRDGTRNVALACKACGAEMVYLSSGSVFSGRLGRPARESDTPDPVNVYGKSKLAGENEIPGILEKYYIIRTGWMMGGGMEKDKKFVGKIMRKILAGEKDFKIINDKFGNPMYAKDLLAGIKGLTGLGRYGTYHMVNGAGSRSSRYEMALAIKKILKMDNLKISPVASNAFNMSAPRALSEELENFKLKETGLGPMRPWEDALEEYLAKDWRLECLR